MWDACLNQRNQHSAVHPVASVLYILADIFHTGVDRL